VEDLGPATDHEVIVAWLRAEIESPRFANAFRYPWDTTEDRAYLKQIIETPDLDDPAQNHIRKTRLATGRGYGWAK
jgi:hypothetical protein